MASPFLFCSLSFFSGSGVFITVSRVKVVVSDRGSHNGKSYIMGKGRWVGIMYKRAFPSRPSLFFRYRFEVKWGGRVLQWL
jgi:hypothetical protein